MGIKIRQIPMMTWCKAVNSRLWLIIIAGMVSCSKHDSLRANEATLPELNRALAMWTMERGSDPKTIDDLTNFPILRGKQLPLLPPGKKLVLDPASHLIIITNE
jgi:hypothetical protein